MKYLFTGGNGFLARNLGRRLVSEGHAVFLLSRRLRQNQPDYPNSPAIIPWDGRNTGSWTSAIEGSDVVVNLAGESIAGGRWTAGRKKGILQSRVGATRAIVQALREAKRKPRVLLSASAVGYYGNVERGDVNEDGVQGSGFLADVCGQWEREALEARQHGVRVVLMRFGVVLGRDGGALARMMIPFRLFLGGPIGSGNQWLPWIHLDDVFGIMKFAVERPAIAGPLNVVAPELVTMQRFCASLGAAMRRPSWLPVPAILLRAAFGEMAGTLLTGQRVLPHRLRGFGYSYIFPSLVPAIEEAVTRHRQ